MAVVGQQVQYIGGTDGTGRPSPFLCCFLRMLELEPLSDMIDVYLNQLGYKLFKYLTALALMYIRLAYASEEIYAKLDGFYTDFRKLRVLLKSPVFTATGTACHYKVGHVDELVDDLVGKERVCDIILPRLIPRQRLVEQDLVLPRTYHISNAAVEDDEDTQTGVDEVTKEVLSGDESDFVSDSD